jgi:CubicO group peptidase (beta-lactamase class C family)
MCITESGKGRKKMKRFILTIQLILLSLFLSYCQHKNSNKTPNGFVLPEVKPAQYGVYEKPEVDIQDSDIVHKIHALDCYFENKVKFNGFNGAVLVSFKGTPIFERYYGYKDYPNKEKLTAKSTFQIASTSKTFTSGAVLLLVQQNLMSLDDTLQKFFPNFPYKGVTVRTLLNHRSGLPDYLRFTEEYWKNKKKFMENQDVLDLMIRYKPKLLNKPDTYFKYNNTNYVLLALIVEKVSGIPFCDFLHQAIFVPLGMTDTWLYDPRSPRPSATKGYKGSRWTEDQIIYTDGVTGDKGIYSTVRDLYKWDQALYSGKYLRPEILGLAFTPQSFEKPGNKNYGLGWRMQDQADGTRMIYHNGWWHSYTSAFNRKLSDKSAVIILSNHFVSSSYKSQEVWDILYGSNAIKSDDEEGSTDVTKSLNIDTLQQLQKK